jgi:hypothetical protein
MPDKKEDTTVHYGHCPISYCQPASLTLGDISGYVTESKYFINGLERNNLDIVISDKDLLTNEKGEKIDTSFVVLNGNLYLRLALASHIDDCLQNERPLKDPISSKPLKLPHPADPWDTDWVIFSGHWHGAAATVSVIRIFMPGFAVWEDPGRHNEIYQDPITWLYGSYLVCMCVAAIYSMLLYVSTNTGETEADQIIRLNALQYIPAIQNQSDRITTIDSNDNSNQSDVTNIDIKRNVL